MNVMYPAVMRNLGFLACFVLAACGAKDSVYTHDGVTNGDAFYLAPAAYANDDPAYQAWVVYSLMKSTCQLEIGGENPARANSFDCELTSRRHLVNAWEEKRNNNQGLSDEYLSVLGNVNEAGFLAEYTLYYFGNKDWLRPNGLRLDEFKRWRKLNLKDHQPVTRITGSWNYRANVEKPPT